MNKKTVRDIDVKGKKILVRCDFNVPLNEEGVITDNTRITAVAEELTNLLDSDVKFASDVTGSSAKETVNSLQDGEVALLENVRFDPREEKNDDTLSAELASLTDGIYVNDAFGTAHRAHSSTEGVRWNIRESIKAFCCHIRWSKSV